MKIPKVLHQTWYTSQPHKELADRIEENKKQNPDWQYKLWSDDDIIAWMKSKNLKKDLELFESIAVGPAKADLFRMLILYYEGGFYMDLDNTLAMPLNDFLNPKAECLCAMNNLRRIDFNLCASVPKNIYVENTLRAIRERLTKRVDGSALSVTGPCNWKSHNRNNKKNYPNREYRLQIVGPISAKDAGWPKYPQGQVGTPSEDHWIQPITFVFGRDRKPWRSLPKDRPVCTWQGVKSSLYKK
jgi:mannosyltransferase OCH1-like enzyme